MKKEDDEDEWGGLNLDKGNQKSGNFGSRLLGRKSLPKDDDDDLDKFLDHVDQIEGMDTKIPSPKENKK